MSLTAQVARRGDGLVARIVEGGFRELALVRGLVFQIEQSRVEFTDDGRLLTTLGEFTRTGAATSTG